MRYLISEQSSARVKERAEATPTPAGDMKSDASPSKQRNGTKYT